MKLPLPLVLLAGLGTLAACDSAPSTSATQPDSRATPPPPALLPDTTRPASQANGKVPFVPSTKIGRILGSQSPSPPASRTR